MVKNIVILIILTVLIWVGVSALKPFWNRYWLEKDMKACAIYGTKNTIEETRKSLTKKMEEEGHDFDGEDFIIEKDENNRVSVTLAYDDKISVFNITVKELEFTVEATAQEVNEYF